MLKRSLCVAALIAGLGGALGSLAQSRGGGGIATQSGPFGARTGATDAQPASIDLPEDLVIITASVTGPKNASVPNLGQDRFHIFEDDVEQKIEYFRVDSRPITVGFVFDNSEIMELPEANPRIETLRDAGAAFLKTKTPEDEYFVVQFSDLPAMTVSFTTDARLMPHAFPAVGVSSLYDAVFLGLELLKEAANPRKILMVITAGGDKGGEENRRGVRDWMLVDAAIRGNSQIYSIFIPNDGQPPDPVYVYDDSVLMEQLGSLSGGQGYLGANSAFGVEQLCEEIARGLKTQYLIGYRPANSAKDGKRRALKVKVTPPNNSPKLKVWAKVGYYAPKEKAKGKS